MINQYFILVDKRDSEKFRRFTNGSFNDVTKQILEKNNCRFIWSIHKGQIKTDIWKQIKKNDYVFFSEPKNNFKIVGQISKKIINNDIGKLMWPDSLDKDHITNFLLFNKLEKSNVQFYDMINNSSSKIIIPIPGIYKIKKAFKNNISNQIDQHLSDKIELRPKTFLMPKTNGPPQKNFSEVYRFLRDSSLVKQLKMLYQNKCQICNYTFEYQKNKFYSEVHHYNPLEENGNDDVDNMIVVCPNHHAEFDHKIIAIDIDAKNIIDKNGNKIGEIYFHEGHKLDKKNIQSQLIKK